jgi:hypothetical protein
MCRYAFHSYKSHNVCFHCRKMFKAVLICPQCGRQTQLMGLDFKVPKQNDAKQWRKVEILYANGIRFGSCGCGGPGYRPKYLYEVKQFLETSREIVGRKSEGEKLLEKIDRQTGRKRK